MSFDYIKYVLPYRRRNQARGLNVFGHKRKDLHLRHWPELAGLSYNEYHRRYKALRKMMA